MSRESLCPIFEHCGLCLHLKNSKEEEKRQKQKNLHQILSIQSSEFVDSPNTLAYRYRITLRSNEIGRLGYYKPKTHQHIQIKECAIANDSINRFLRIISPAPANIHSVEIRSNGPKTVLSIKSKKGKNVPHKKIRTWAAHLVDGISLNGRPIFGDTMLHFTVANTELMYQPDTFFQVNPYINENILSAIVSFVEQVKPTHILDIFSGAGNIGLPLARKGYNVTLMESNKSATTDAQNNATHNNLSVKTIQKNAYTYKAGSVFFDMLILDPPRAGCGKALEQYLLTKPKTIVYLSCNPYTLSQDAKRILEKGYKYKKITLYNMFPLTNHIETLCFFEKK